MFAELGCPQITWSRRVKDKNLRVVYMEGGYKTRGIVRRWPARSLKKVDTAACHRQDKKKKNWTDATVYKGK